MNIINPYVMKLYHITEKEYEKGSKVSVESFVGATRYYDGLSEENKPIDDFLSAGRPDNEPSRKKCIYAFDKPEYCYYYGRSQMTKAKTLHLYKCEMDCLLGHPMILVGYLSKKLSKSQRKQIHSEYWNPTRDWYFLEYLSTKMDIIEEITIDDDLESKIYAAGSNYADDYDEAKRLYP